MCIMTGLCILYTITANSWQNFAMPRKSAAHLQELCHLWPERLGSVPAHLFHLLLPGFHGHRVPLQGWLVLVDVPAQQRDVLAPGCDVIIWHIGLPTACTAEHQSRDKYYTAESSKGANECTSP